MVMTDSTGTDSTGTDSTGTDSTGIAWKASGEYTDIRYETTDDGIAKITICRPEVHNAFRPQTIIEISARLTVAREDESVGVIILTGEGDKAFCSGGDQRVRGDSGYKTDEQPPAASTSPTCTCRCAAAPSRSSPWWPAGPSAAATCCTWSAT